MNIYREIFFSELFKTICIMIFFVGLFSIVFLFFFVSVVYSQMYFSVDDLKEVSVEKDKYGYPEIVIKDEFNIDKDISKIKIYSHTPECLGECESEMNITIYEKMSLIDDIKFVDKNNNLLNLSYNIYLYEKDDYFVKVLNRSVTNCSSYIVYDNKTLEPFEEQDCVKIDYYDDVIMQKNTYNLYNLGEIRPVGSYLMKVKARKPLNVDVDYQVKVGGVWIEELAWWNSNYDYRICFNLTSPDSDRFDEPVFVNYSKLTENSPANLDGEDIDSFVLINGSGADDVEVPFEIIDNNPYGNHSASTYGDVHRLVFTSNATNGQNEEYCLYYGNSEASNSETDFVYWFDDFTSNSSANYSTYNAEYEWNSTGYVQADLTSGSNSMIVSAYDVNQTSNDYQVFATTRSTTTAQFFVGVGGWSLSRGDTRNNNNADGMVIDSYDASNKYRIIDYDASISVLGSGSKNIDINNNWVDEILYLEDLGSGNSNVTYFQDGSPVVGFNTGAFSPQLGRPMMLAGASDYMQYDNFGAFAVWTHPKVNRTMIVLEMGSEEANNPPDTTPPYFTTIANQSLNNVTALSYDMDADDETAFSNFSIDDTTNFSIVAETGVLTNNTQLAVFDYTINVSIRDTSNNLNSSLLGISVSGYNPPAESNSSNTASVSGGFDFWSGNSDPDLENVYAFGSWRIRDATLFLIMLMLLLVFLSIITTRSIRRRRRKKR